MKSREEVLRRLRKLRIRYLRQHMLASQDRLPANCVHNYEHASPSVLQDEKQRSVGDSLRPVRTASLVVLPERKDSVRLCLYGSDDPASWSGDICDTAQRAQSCPWFKPSIDPEAAKQAFLGRLSDDEYVLRNYPDIAALQWVVEDRLHRHKVSLVGRFLLWVLARLFRTPRLTKAPDLSDSDLQSLWEDDSPPHT